MDMYDKITELYEKRRHLELGGGEKRIATQHQKGKQTARERIRELVDTDTFVELNPFMMQRSPNKEANGEGVVTGYGKIKGIPVYLFSQDFTVYGGALGEMHGKKIANAMDLAAKNSMPFIGLIDSGGARIHEGVSALDGYGQVFYRNVLYSGVIPQISVILGPSAGGAVYSPAITDFIIMVEETSQMFITGPKIIETVTGEQISVEALGGAAIHNSQSGNAHFQAKTEQEALKLVKQLLQYLPSNCKEKPQETANDYEKKRENDLIDIVPVNSRIPYNVKDVLHHIIDKDSLLEVQPYFAKNIVIGFARLNGKSVGLVCNQPKYLAGGLDIHSSDKAARFIRFCDAFQIPLITLEDVTGFIPGVKQEHSGIIRHGAKILYAYAEATVPKITVILRKAYGGAYVALNSKSIGADIVYAWPNAEIAVMGAESAINVLFAEELAKSENPDQLKQEKMHTYQERFTNPYEAASLGMIDDIIDPRETRSKLIEALDMLANKQENRPFKKHGNIPL
ncbi:acyl-CoA carboxylase subunit beta [Virgibacillus salexigens]|uniref:acyl-CoA carboxylase subunit beta n=1 Tax=Virgibacillus massiliensis TaxID=1462526 RepID=UPI00136FB3A4|nr:acyl-CoA carboxylase subunit beta [Virgibacillus massiliensis]MYL41895.1 methylmalonyl-CoA carboxyltransferase [Virgibacillus massiliensis]